MLDTHRLLIPDEPWIWWMEHHPDARARAWVLARDGTVSSQVISDGGIQSEKDRPSLLAKLERCLNALALQDNGKKVHFSPDRIVPFWDTGCIVAEGAVGSEAASGTPASVVALVSCPSWYYGRNPRLTCLLPRQAAAELRRRDPCGGLQPDAMMSVQDTSARWRAHDRITRYLYENASPIEVNRICLSSTCQTDQDIS